MLYTMEDRSVEPSLHERTLLPRRNEGTNVRTLRIPTPPHPPPPKKKQQKKQNNTSKTKPRKKIKKKNQKKQQKKERRVRLDLTIFI